MTARIIMKTCIALIIGSCISGPVLAAKTQAPTTLDNLQAAFNGESNARVRYTEFAVKADAEGYKQVAALFRAAAKSEEIHAANFSKEIVKLHAEPKSNIKTIDVKTTKENLEAALKGESYEKNTLYPGFAKKAETDKNMFATRSFKGAIAAETMHAKLFSEALADMDAWRTPNKEFLVCTICGYTTDDATLKQCPVCAAPRDKFVSFK